MKLSYSHKGQDGLHLAVLDLIQIDGGFLITRLNVPKEMRGQGVAKLLLQKVCLDADNESHKLSLEFAPYPGTDPQRLKELYASFGFAFQTKTVMRRIPVPVEADNDLNLYAAGSDRLNNILWDIKNLMMPDNYTRAIPWKFITRTTNKNIRIVAVEDGLHTDIPLKGMAQVLSHKLKSWFSEFGVPCSFHYGAIKIQEDVLLEFHDRYIKKLRTHQKYYIEKATFNSEVLTRSGKPFTGSLFPVGVLHENAVVIIGNVDQLSFISSCMSNLLMGVQGDFRTYKSYVTQVTGYEPGTSILKVHPQVFCLFNLGFKSVPDVSPHVSGHELLKAGGTWLGVAREEMQRLPGGENLTWASQDKVNITVAQLEELVAYTVAHGINEFREDPEGFLKRFLPKEM